MYYVVAFCIAKIEELITTYTWEVVIMKKRMHLTIAVVVIMAFVLAGCGKSNFGVVINEDLNPEITAENASVDSTGQAGTFTVGENEKVLITPDLDEGKVSVQFILFSGAEDENASLEEITTQDPVLEAEVSGSDPQEYDLDAGDYMIAATVTEKATGTIVLSTGNRDSSSSDTGSEELKTVLINTEGMGQIAYAEEGGTPEFNDDFPAQSTQISIAEPANYVLAAKADDGWEFVKWTKDGEDYSEDEQIEVELDSSVVFVAVFDIAK